MNDEDDIDGDENHSDNYKCVSLRIKPHQNEFIPVASFENSLPLSIIYL